MIKDLNDKSIKMFLKVTVRRSHLKIVPIQLLTVFLKVKMITHYY